MALLGRRLAVSIPDTVLEEKTSHREKTAKLGLIVRACVIYGVDLIEVFRDPRGRSEGTEIRRILEFLETPQYLRRRLFPLDETLKYAGILPPLRIPSHRQKVPIELLTVGEVRDGVVNKDGTIDIGLDRPATLTEKLPPGRRVTVEFVSTSPLVARPVAREHVKEYWGYMVEQKSAAEVLTDSRFKLKIGTSRLGTPLKDAIVPLGDLVGGADSIKLIFGSPSRGLFDIYGMGLKQQVNLVVNLFPGQQVETVRTEEAIFAGLGLLGLLSLKKA
jgi:methyltransferase